ncbi:hypothetical protein C8J56DRAFT_1093967 [Mycena floridula]|nr:hypothetical protein C8J56DRAFT_1093967 [Mycena floridula]
MSSNKQDIFRKPAQHLGRGKACFNCRGLKIKCDAAKPVCSNCVRVPKKDPCEYNESPLNATELQSTIARLEARVRELETFMPAGESSHDVSVAMSPGASPTPSSSYLDDSLFTFEPPSHLVESILDAFLPHSQQCGFFLYIRRFRQLALLPSGDPLRPCPALLSVVWLWGVHILQSDLYLGMEQKFLNQAVSQLAVQVCTSRSILETIQAHLLLSVWFLRNTQCLQAEFYMQGAVCLALCQDLHRVRSARPLAPTLLGVSDGQETYPAAPRDIMEEGQYINGFWMVFAWERALSVALRTAVGFFGTLEAPHLNIDTPWPLDLESCANNTRILAGTQSVSTIQNFLQANDVVGDLTDDAMHAKAIVLFHYSCHLSGRWHYGTDAARFALTGSCSVLGSAIARFKLSLPSVSSQAARHTLFVTHTLANAASMTLHGIYASSGNIQSKGESISSAQWILRSLSTLDLTGVAVIHPIIGSLVALACNTLIDEIRNIQSLRAIAGPVGFQEDEKMMRGTIMEGIAGLSILADCPLMRYQLAKVQETFNAV